MRYLAVFLCLAVLAGCASNRSVAESWMGSDIDDVAAKWGSPLQTMVHEDGRYTYMYVRPTPVGGEVAKCLWSFTTDPTGSIVSADYPSNANRDELCLQAPNPFVRARPASREKFDVKPQPTSSP